MSSKFTNRRGGGGEDRTKSIGYDTRSRIIRITSSDVITCKYGPPFSIFDFGEDSSERGRTCTYANSWRLLSTANSRSMYYTYRIGYWRRRPIDHGSPTIRFIKERAFARAQPPSPLFSRETTRAWATWKPRISHVFFPPTRFLDLLDRCFDSVSMLEIAIEVRENVSICIRVCQKLL